jgi:serine beta-lactamase-like protein LACTB
MVILPCYYKFLNTIMLFLSFCLLLPGIAWGEPADAPQNMKLLFGQYTDGQQIFLVREKAGNLELLFEKDKNEAGETVYDVQPLETVSGGQYRWLKTEDGGLRLVMVRFLRDASGRGIECRLGEDVVARRMAEPVAADKELRLSARDWDNLRKQTKKLQMPVEQGTFLSAELVSITAMDRAIKLDMRYGTENNRWGAKLYEGEQGFLQRPAAEALGRVQQQLKLYGYGLLVYDAYRPWFVTKMAWDAATEKQRVFLDDPAVGSRYNRGASVDVGLYELVSGEPLSMPGDYEETTLSVKPAFAGGTELTRWRRDLLRQFMEKEGFIGSGDVWWRFDYHTWRQYPLVNKSFEDIAPVLRIKLGGAYAY